MPRIAPESSQEQSEYQELFSNAGKKTQRNGFVNFILSFRLFLVILIMALVIATAFSIWLAAYFMNEQSAVESTKILLDTIKGKVSNFLDGPLLMAKSTALAMADDYHRSVIQADHSICPYFHNRLVNNNVTLMTIGFGEGMNVLFAVDSKGFAFQNNTQPKITIVSLNTTLGLPIYSKVTMNIPYMVNKTDYYIESMNVLKQFPNGGYGAPYKVLSDGVQSMYYSAPVYDKTNWPFEKKKIGIAKTNISLGKISSFMSKMEILERGYIILSEYDNDMIIGANLNITRVGFDRIPIRNVTVRSAGSLMNKFLALNAAEGQIVKVQGDDGISYMITTSSYSIDNLKWRMTIVCEENEIKKSVIMSSYVILGVSIGVAFIGVILSIVIGYAITKPLKIIQDDFAKIEVMNLSKIKHHSSVFTEIRNIYNSLTDTVQWLNEFRAFLPENILNQLESSSTGEVSEEQPKKINEGSEKPRDSNHDLMSKPSFQGRVDQSMAESKSGLSSSMMSTDHAKKKVDLFKLGLSSFPSSIIYIKLSGFTESAFENHQEMSNLISKCYINILQICKTMKVDVHTKSFDEFAVVQHDNLSAIETSLKIKSFFSSLNETLKNEGKLQIQLQIGISSNACLLGNIGNKQMRYFTMIGSAMKCARDLAFFNSLLETKILVDEKTYLKNKAHVNYIFIPVERYSGVSVGHTDGIQCIYELVKKGQVSEDEWLYELEQKKSNERMTNLCEKFPLIFNPHVTDEHVKDFIASIEELQPLLPNYSKLWEHLTKLAKKRLFESEDLTQYHSIIGITTESSFSFTSTHPEHLIDL